MSSWRTWAEACWSPAWDRPWPDLGLAPAALAAEGAERLTFGPMEPLVALMQETPADRLLPAVVERIKAGTDLRQLVAAAALANARTFGGQDYDGYHAIMALVPAYQMSRELPEAQRALPVLKVLYRNTNHIQQMGGRTHEALHARRAGRRARRPRRGRKPCARRPGGRTWTAAERTFAALARGPLDEAYNDLQYVVQDDIDVHRVVLAWRSWALLDLTGKEHAHTLLRQSVRFCVDEESELHRYKNHGEEALRALLPKLLDRNGLASRSPGRPPAGRRLGRADVPDDLRLAAGSRPPRRSPRPWPRGSRPRSSARRSRWPPTSSCSTTPAARQADSPAKPMGSVHGASVGVHASDAANAWRNIARVSDRRNTYASLIVGAYHTAGQAGGLNPKPYPFAEHREKVRDVKPDALLPEAEAAIKANDQARACALVHRYGELGRPARPVFDLLLRYAISEDGALHAEKYYRTVTEEFATTRPAFRWRQLAALARVTASEYGYPAPGVAEARRLLKANPVG